MNVRQGGAPSDLALDGAVVDVVVVCEADVARAAVGRGRPERLVVLPVAPSSSVSTSIL